MCGSTTEATIGDIKPHELFYCCGYEALVRPELGLQILVAREVCADVAKQDWRRDHAHYKGLPEGSTKSFVSRVSIGICDQ